MKKFFRVLFCVLLCCIFVINFGCNGSGGGDKKPTQVAITGAPPQTYIYNEYNNIFTLNASADKSGCEFIWTSSNTNVLTVNGGKVTVCGEGSATITVKIKNYENISKSVNITTKFLGLEINGAPQNGKIDISNNTLNLSSRILTNGSDDFNVVWSSSDESILTVDQNGVVEFVKVGAATVKVVSQQNNKVYAVKTLFVIDSTANQPLFESFNQASVDNNKVKAKFDFTLSTSVIATLQKTADNRQLVFNKESDSANASITISTDKLQTGGKYKLSFVCNKISGEHSMNVEKKDDGFISLGTISNDGTFSIEFTATKPTFEFRIISTLTDAFSISLDQIKFELVEQGDYMDDIL